VSVVEIGALHARYVRLSDRFKSIWTFHQFASGVFKNLVDEPLPYSIDFQKVYERIKAISGTLNAAQATEAAAAIDLAELALDRTTSALLRADDRISPSIVRRFFEKLKSTDENIIHFLIKFFLYADAVEADRRDKIDYLFTRIGEDFMADRGEYWSRDSLEFREKIIALVSILRTTDPPQDEVVRLIRVLRSMRDEIVGVAKFEELTERNLLRNTRVFKHRLGDIYFHPDVLMAVVELNVTTKNRFMKLYQAEEERLMADAEKLMEHGNAIERNFGETNPDLVDEIARFREAKERFDELRAQSNVKHDVITQLKLTMSNILAQLDRGVTNEEELPPDLPQNFFRQTEQNEAVKERFRSEEELLPYILRITETVDGTDPAIVPEQAAELDALRELRLEPWEIAAYEKLFDRRDPEAEEDTEELWILYLRAAALRIKIDEEATILATAMAAGVHPENELTVKAKQSLDNAKALDEQFGDFLHEAVYYSNPRILHQLYRSRFRLLRGFSGLWLIYDRQN
jgi:hypothetical protein